MGNHLSALRNKLKTKKGKSSKNARESQPILAPEDGIIKESTSDTCQGQGGSTQEESKAHTLAPPSQAPPPPPPPPPAPAPEPELQSEYTSLSDGDGCELPLFFEKNRRTGSDALEAAPSTPVPSLVTPGSQNAGHEHNISTLASDDLPPQAEGTSQSLPPSPPEPSPRSPTRGELSVPKTHGSTSYLQGASGVAIGTANTTLIGGDHIVNIHNHNSEQLASQTNLDTVRNEIRQWLKAPNFFVIHRAAMELRTGKTGTWFIESKEFQEWANGQGAALWCTGMPGAGKTILASTSIEHLQSSYERDNSVVVVFAYLRYSEKRTHRGILSGLMHQFLDSDAAVIKVQPLYRQLKDDDLEFTKSELIDALKAVVTCFKKAYAVIDGLDEASNDTKDALLSVLGSMGINLLIFSRPLETFMHHISTSVCVSIQARNNDIALYISEQYEKNSRLRKLLPSTGLTKLKDLIFEKAQGMFLLAKLQLESIMHNAMCAKDLFDSLEKLPPGVEDMYHLTLQRVAAQPPKMVSVAHRVFVWLLYPVTTLSIGDMQQALAVDANSYTFENDAVVDVELILLACQGLVTLTGPFLRNDGDSSSSSSDDFSEMQRNGTAQSFDIYIEALRLTHYSTREFLRTVPLPTAPNPYTSMALTCLGYINQPKPAEARDSETTSSCSFMEHAIHNWGHYARRSQDDEAASHPEIISALAKYPPANCKHASRALSVAARHGLVEVIKSRVLQFPDCPLPRCWSESPFYIAVHQGDFQVFTALLSTYGTQNLPVVTSSPPNEFSFLHAILRSKAPLPFLEKVLAIAKSGLLPDHMKLDLNAQDASGKTPLMVACQLAGGEDAIRLLISQPGLDMDLRDRGGRKASHWAAITPLAESNGLHILLTSFPGLDAEMADSEGTTVFMAACVGGHDRFVYEILTRRTVDSRRLTRQTNPNGVTALMAVLASQPLPSHRPIVRLLLDYGSDLHARESEGGYTPFLLAVIQHCEHVGNEDVAHGALALLLDADPSLIGQRDHGAQTGLMFAARSASPTLVPFLVSHARPPHVDPAQFLNATDSEGRTALMHAIETQDYYEPFAVLYALLDVEGGWDVRCIRKAVIAGVRILPDDLVFRFLLEDWVIHSFVWSEEDEDTVALCDGAASWEPLPHELARGEVTRPGRHCTRLKNIIDAYIREKPSSLPRLGWDASNIEGWAKLFGGPGCSCSWHADTLWRCVRAFRGRKAYSELELEKMIRKDIE